MLVYNSILSLQVSRILCSCTNRTLNVTPTKLNDHQHQTYPNHKLTGLQKLGNQQYLQSQQINGTGFINLQGVLIY